MAETSSSETVSTKLQRVAELARKAPDMVLTTLAHHIDIDFLREAWYQTRKDGAPGVDGVTAEEYEAGLEGNLQLLLGRFHTGTYRAPPVRRTHIPKGDGKKTRPIGIPTLEDKVLQRAVKMVLEAVYEQDFLSCSYGFRPGRSAHQALQALRDGLMEVDGGWVLELDIQSFFDTLVHGHLRAFLDKRVRDGVIRRTIDKWLKAGVMEDGQLFHPDSGSPQGGVISPMLANIYLHEVLDLWFEQQVKPRMRGRTTIVRYADDVAMVFEREDDAQRVLAVLPKRFGKYGLTLHPEKTRLLDFRRPGNRPRDGGTVPPGTPRSFQMLGFTHYWTRSRRGFWVVKQKTDAKRFSRALRALNQWCRTVRHQPVWWQSEWLGLKLRGHFAYYGLTGNFDALDRFRRAVIRIWRKWLSRRSQNGYVNWDQMNLVLVHSPLPAARVVHSAYRK
ncbi:MAG: group II intron reverse transcriptase/maturase [Planctomycetes bacterium]|jgi:group II intron reverse transcriptase/maturase|nr:group II intron reverse transcriptase/maturase [Planctomycetota bacterium]